MRSPLLFLAAALLPSLALSAPDEGDGATPKDLAAAGASPATASKRFTVAPGLQVDLWASEPLIENVVAFCFDEKGRAYVVETGRRRTSVPDIRKHMDWLLPSLALRTVDERVSFLKDAYPTDAPLKPDHDHADLNGDGVFDWQDLAVESERIQLVEDSDGDGVADKAVTFAEGFNGVGTGVAAGVLASGGSVYFACIPELWKFPAAGGSIAPAAGRTALATGFGVHVAYGGHDMHGTKMGPDGRLYWSIADCGARVVTKEGKLIEMQDMGGVFRCEPDGSKMEVFARGLRNPESLAFNDVGDLFTGDNNADGGDKARWEHVVEGADYGWRIGWQFLPKLGAWNSELLWGLDAGTTAYAQLPPVAHIGHGPSGIAYYPGTGLPASYAGSFFYADFPGGVRSFNIERKGAGYTTNIPGEVLLSNKQAEMTNKLLWGLYPTDVQFGLDGGAYVLDWVEGWDKTGTGRIFRVHDLGTDASAEVKATKQIITQGFAQRPDAELVELLGNLDQRVRLGAQFALAKKGEAAIPTLTAAADRNSAPLKRLHAIWGLGQIGRQSPKAVPALVALLRDVDADVRGQATKAAADCAQIPPANSFLPLLQDPEPRVRFFAAQALGKVKSPEAVPALLAAAEANADSDPYLRHAIVVALAACGDVPALTTQIRHKNDAVRAVVLLALRRLQRPEVAAFLQDPKPQLVLEAARAIHDEPIDAALPELSALPATGQVVPIARRIINAGYRLGSPGAAETLARIAQDPQTLVAVRLDALEALAQWNEPLGRDRVLGTWRAALPGHDPVAASHVATGMAPKLLSDPSKDLQMAALALVSNGKVVEAEFALVELLHNAKADPLVRGGALQALSAIESPKITEAMEFAKTSNIAALKAVARRLANKLSPAEALADTIQALEKGDLAERQAAFQSLATFKDGAVDKALEKWMGSLISGKVTAALQLDILEAANLSKSKKVADKVETYEKTRKADDPVARFRECLEGGDAEAGRTIFYEKAEAACLRCHKVKGEGGDVGPDLAGIATKHDRNYILKSIVSPNADIAPGFETVLLTLKDGNMVIGIASAENAEEYTITPLTGGEKQKVKKATVKSRDKVPSAMPEGMAEILGKHDLRNVVEYLSSLK